MAHDRVTRLHVGGMRCIEEMDLDLRQVTVLIGDNGAGKSTILEALELLRWSGIAGSFVKDIVVDRHGGLRTLRRSGSPVLRLGVRVEGGGEPLEYQFGLAEIDRTPTVVEERLYACRGENMRVPVVLRERATEALVQDPDVPLPSGGRRLPFSPDILALVGLGTVVPPSVARVRDALAAVEVHPSFETRPLWQHEELRVQEGPRQPSLVQELRALPRFARHLPSAYHQLRNQGEASWAATLEHLRLGLGWDLREVRTPASGRRGQVDLELVYGSAPDAPISVDVLSEGQVAYLAFVALAGLNRDRSVLAVDEPELHLHPALLGRVVGIFEELSERAPVVLATHSNALLDRIGEGAAVVLCALDEHRTTQLAEPDPGRLKAWLQNYAGIGSIRAGGLEPHLFARGEDTDEARRGE